MKFLILWTIVAVNYYKVIAREPGSQYLPPSINAGAGAGVDAGGFGGGGPSRIGAGIAFGGGGEGSGRFVGQSQYQGTSTAQRPISQFNKQQTSAVLIPILRNNFQSDGYGNYNFGFETANGIRREENGIFENVGPEGSLNVQGSYSYTGDDGRIYSINYKADSSGFHAIGDHLPTPPTATSRQQQQQQQFGSTSYSAFRGGVGGVGGMGGGSAFRRQQQQHSTGSFTIPNINYLPPSVGGALSSTQSRGYNYARPH